MAVSGFGLASTTVGVIFLWSAVKGASITDTVRSLIEGEQPTGETKYPIVVPERQESTGGTGGPVPGSDDKSGGFGTGGLSSDAKKAGDLIIEKFGNPYGIGGYRGGPGAQDHGTGHAIDVMVSPGGKKASGGQVTRGNAIADWARRNYKALNVKYVIWQQRIWNPSVKDSWRKMENRGSVTQNHYDHVHISFN